MMLSPHSNTETKTQLSNKEHTSVNNIITNSYNNTNSSSDSVIDDRNVLHSSTAVSHCSTAHFSHNLKQQHHESQRDKQSKDHHHAQQQQRTTPANNMSLNDIRQQQIVWNQQQQQQQGGEGNPRTTCLDTTNSIARNRNYTTGLANNTHNEASSSTVSGLHSSPSIGKINCKKKSHQKAINGFISYVLTIVSLVIFIFWMMVPAPILHMCHFSYYPDKYWGLALPAAFVMALVCYWTSYMILLLRNTQPLNSMLQIIDGHTITNMVSFGGADRDKKSRLVGGLLSDEGRQSAVASSTSNPALNKRLSGSSHTLGVPGSHNGMGFNSSSSGAGGTDDAVDVPGVGASVPPLADIPVNVISKIFYQPWQP
eukprot:Tbor_TRINITY_DN5321_c0_g2::TRINITY_DN5321_c0_g2_i1::g.4141::m.4141